jgi:hypothetical protein
MLAGRRRMQVATFARCRWRSVSTFWTWPSDTLANRERAALLLRGQHRRFRQGDGRSRSRVLRSDTPHLRQRHHDAGLACDPDRAAAAAELCGFPQMAVGSACSAPASVGSDLAASALAIMAVIAATAQLAFMMGLSCERAQDLPQPDPDTGSRNVRDYADGRTSVRNIILGRLPLSQIELALWRGTREAIAYAAAERDSLPGNSPPERTRP